MIISQFLISTFLISLSLSKSFLQYESNYKDFKLLLDYNPIEDLNQQPVIGIVTQTLEDEMKSDPRFSNYTSYVMSAYVNWLQAAGARIIPLIVTEPRDVTLSKLQKLNGVLFPGGDGDYHDYGKYIYEKLEQLNNNGTFYPLWGTCLGYEYMILYASNDTTDKWGIYNYPNGSLPIKFIKDPKQTRMYEGLGNDAYQLERRNSLYNSHHYGIHPDKFVTDFKLKEAFEVTAVSYMPEPDGRVFTASMEHKKYPFFGTQFHPEKVTQIFLDDKGIDHTWKGIQLNRHFADYFVQLSRQNQNKFGNFKETQKEIIQKYDHIVTDGYYGDVYVFN